MATWDSPDLLSRFRFLIGRPDVDEAMSDPEAYRILSEANERVTEELGTHIPWMNYGAPEKMVTTDGGYTYTISVDAIGHIEVLASTKSPPLKPGAYWDGSADYSIEGPRTIRITSGRSRTFADGPYARYVPASPAQLSATQNPVLQPERARILIVQKAASIWATRGGRRDPGVYDAMYAKTFIPFILAEKNKYYGQGAEAWSASQAPWWNSGDLGN